MTSGQSKSWISARCRRRLADSHLRFGTARRRSAEDGQGRGRCREHHVAAKAQVRATPARPRRPCQPARCESGGGRPVHSWFHRQFCCPRVAKRPLGRPEAATDADRMGSDWYSGAPLPTGCRERPTADERERPGRRKGRPRALLMGTYSNLPLVCGCCIIAGRGLVWSWSGTARRASFRTFGGRVWRGLGIVKPFSAGQRRTRCWRCTAPG
jgi:hypothetical protein